MDTAHTVPHPAAYTGGQAAAQAAALAALAAVRRMLRDARTDAAVERRRVDDLVTATDWQARATRRFHAGVAVLADRLIELDLRIDAADGELADAESRLRAQAATP